jgi:hypothetical protein
MEFETVQEENNKRRIEVNNLKRQLIAIDNLQVELDTARAAVNKKNQEIGELKTSLY